MLQGQSGHIYEEYIQPVVRPVAQGISGAAEKVGLTQAADRAGTALQPAAKNVHEAMQPVNQGIYNVTEKASAGFYAAVIQPVAQQLYGGSSPEAPGSNPSDLNGTLIA